MKIRAVRAEEIVDSAIAFRDNAFPNDHNAGNLDGILFVAKTIGRWNHHVVTGLARMGATLLC